MQDVYKNIEEYNINKECKILIVFDHMITVWLITRGRGRKLNMETLIGYIGLEIQKNL